MAGRTRKTYRVGNPREIPDGVPVAVLANGRELQEGDRVRKDQVDDETRDAWIASGILEE